MVLGGLARILAIPGHSDVSVSLTHTHADLIYFNIPTLKCYYVVVTLHKLQTIIPLSSMILTSSDVFSNKAST